LKSVLFNRPLVEPYVFPVGLAESMEGAVLAAIVLPKGESVPPTLASRIGFRAWKISWRWSMRRKMRLKLRLIKYDPGALSANDTMAIEDQPAAL